jgi:hypothetical protein
MFREIIGGRADGVGVAHPNVAPAVPFEVDGVGEVARWHELHLSHCARPRAAHHGGSNVAFLQDDQGRQQFVTEIVSAKANIGERRESPNDIVRSDKAAEIRLEPPNAQDDRLVDAIGRFGLGEPDALRIRLFATALDTVGRDGAGDVVPNRKHELGLSSRHGDDLRIEGDAGERAIEGRPRDPALLGERPKRGDEFLERLLPRGGEFLEGVPPRMNGPFGCGGVRGKSEAGQYERDEASAQKRQSRARKQAFAALALHFAHFLARRAEKFRVQRLHQSQQS